ncbi:hypothetical protein BJ508DRAFT_415617 [Ascobolus immersus RN42]|uniref:Uncharacterized protein n=1 Tax=Ascobolus immersus RN42 TaxID=1160509 RepID=A0A3N4IE28_ASCIM|nr:hypothetical protein BJ508DRAFT_415617 [Ascobolus immersus RN42]
MVSLRRKGSVATKGAPPPASSAALIAASSVFQPANVASTTTTSTAANSKPLRPTASTRRRSMSLPSSTAPATFPVASQKAAYPTPPSSHSSSPEVAPSVAPVLLNRASSLRVGREKQGRRMVEHSERQPVEVRKEPDAVTTSRMQNVQLGGKTTITKSQVDSSRNQDGSFDARARATAIPLRQQPGIEKKDVDRDSLSDASVYESAPEYASGEEQPAIQPPLRTTKQAPTSPPLRAAVHFAALQTSYSPEFEREPRRWSSDSESDEEDEEIEPARSRFSPRASASSRKTAVVDSDEEDLGAEGVALPQRPKPILKPSSDYAIPVSSTHPTIQRSYSSSSDSVKSASSYKRIRHREAAPWKRSDGTRTMRTSLRNRDKSSEDTSKSTETKPRRGMSGRRFRHAPAGSDSEPDGVHLPTRLRDGEEQKDLARKPSLFSRLMHPHGKHHGKAPAPIETQSTTMDTVPTPPATPAKTTKGAEDNLTSSPTVGKEVHLRETLRDPDHSGQSLGRKESLRSKLTYPYGSKHNSREHLSTAAAPTPVAGDIPEPATREVHLLDTLRDPNHSSSSSQALGRKESLRSKLTYPYGSKHHSRENLPTPAAPTPVAVDPSEPTASKDVHLLDTLRDPNHHTSGQPLARKESLRSKLTYPYGSKHQQHDSLAHQPTATIAPAIQPTSEPNTTTQDVQLLDTLRPNNNTKNHHRTPSFHPAPKESLMSKLTYPYGSKIQHAEPVPQFPETLRDQNAGTGQQDLVRKESLRSKMTYPYGSKMQHTQSGDMNGAAATAVASSAVVDYQDVFPPIGGIGAPKNARRQIVAPSTVSNETHLPQSQQTHASPSQHHHQSHLAEKLHIRNRQTHHSTASPQAAALQEPPAAVHLPEPLRDEQRPVPGMFPSFSTIATEPEAQQAAALPEPRPVPGTFPSFSTIDTLPHAEQEPLALPTSTPVPGNWPSTTTVDTQPAPLPSTNVHLPETLRNDPAPTHRHSLFHREKHPVAPPLQGVELAREESVTAAQAAEGHIVIPAPKEVRKDSFELARDHPGRKGDNILSGQRDGVVTHIDSTPTTSTSGVLTTSQVEMPNKVEKMEDTTRPRSIRDIGFSSGRNGSVYSTGTASEGRSVGDVHFGVPGGEGRKKKGLWGKLMG